jgi:hypothetical protein
LQHLGGPTAARAVAAAGREGQIKPNVAASILGALPIRSQLVVELLGADSERGLLIAAWILEYRESTAIHDLQLWTQHETRELAEAFRCSLERHGETLSDFRRRHLNQWLERRAAAEY